MKSLGGGRTDIHLRGVLQARAHANKESQKRELPSYTHGHSEDSEVTLRHRPREDGELKLVFTCAHTVH